ncbi:MAG: hypothetical protein KDC98_01215 [Planctomycetes bacterium]|nr:hypothetical protein [Planctomycetota bacterium]
MIRRSLYLLGASVLVSLALTLGFALLRLHGPGDVIETAKANLARGEYRRVVSDLDLCEHGESLQRDPSKRQQLYRLRYQAHLALQNESAALRDLDKLLAEIEAPEETLQLDHIRLLALTDQGERALQEARAFLTDHPDHGLALELAGEALQRIYGSELKAIGAAIELEVGKAKALNEARPALLAYLYRPEADDQVQQALHQLQAMFSGQTRLVAAWPPLLQRLQALRVRIQEALGFFQRSLECEGEPIAAFRGLALSLDQSGRFDDLLILCETYRRRFDHSFVSEAGAIAAWMLIDQGLTDAATATTMRWYGPGRPEELIAAGKIGPAVSDLLLARTYAAWKQRDQAALQRIQRDAAALNAAAAESPALAQSNFDARLPQALATALFNYLREREQCLNQLEYATRLVKNTPHGQQDLLDVTMPARIDWLRRHGGTTAEITALCTEWKTARPAAAAPLLALATYQLESDLFSGAMATLDSASELLPDDEGILALRLRAARELYRGSPQDGPGLLAQCRQRETLLPDVPHPICYLLCGETALEAGIAPIALSCARAATDSMKWSRAGRLLEARSELLAGHPAEAAAVLRAVVDTMPPDPETLGLAIEARHAEGLPITDLLWHAMRTMDPSQDLAVEILRHCDGSANATALPFAEAALDRPDATTTSRVLAAATLARLGHCKEAAKTLLAIAPEELTAERHCPTLAAAVASLLRHRAADGTDDPTLRSQATKFFADFGLAAATAVPALLQCAHDLEASHPATAWLLVTTALANARPEDRTGASFALAARLAAHHHQFALAEQHATAALAFADGRETVELLARLCLATDRPERALQVYRLAAAPSDGALALRCGRAPLAAELIQRALLKDPGDLLAHATNAAAGLPSLLPELAPESDAERNTLLELASILRTPEFAELALPMATRYAASKPVAGANMLLARALYQAGKGAEAARIHYLLWQRGTATVPFWREVAAAVEVAGYDTPSPLDQAFATAAATGQLTSVPYAFAAATMSTVKLIEQSAKAPVVAAQLRASVWLQFDPDRPFPANCRPKLSDIDSLAVTGRKLDAWFVLARLLPTLRGAERSQCIDRMLTIADEAESFEPAERLAIYKTVLALARSEGPHGSILHHLLAHGDAFPALRPKGQELDRLLAGHLMLVGSGRDVADRVGATIDRVISDHGPGTALAWLETTLQQQPTALALWSERARLLSMLRRSREGVQDLRRVLAHAEAPEQQLAFCIRAAAEFALEDGDLEGLNRCGKKLLATPAGILARGLVALRTGKPDLAVTLLEQAAPEGGPLRLIALALAQLQSKSDDGVAQAIAALQQLATEFPDSDEARYAKSFARQLGVR